MMDEVNIVVKTTQQLTAAELVNIMYERTKVFVVDQNCAYQEVDHKDGQATHVMLKVGNQLAGYTRIVPHDDGKHISFGRVLVVKKFRGNSFGRQIVTKTINEIQKNYPGNEIKIEGQSYLKKFYESFNFQAVSDPYLIDGIEHIDFVLTS
ncbi:GNAT family N-acetyltransferase [Paucilactobacillus sp. N302-9]